MIKNPQASLPPGFRFHPTDEELILHYLRKKVASTPFAVSVIADVDIYKFNPWDLPAKATSGEKEWYFFSPRDRKYPNGVRPNRAAASGYWKATGTDKIIMASPGTGINGGGQENIGVKKALVFYKGRPPKGVKTNWIMHEYRLADTFNNSYSMKPIKPKDSSMRLDDWVLCRIYKKFHSAPSSTAAAAAAAAAARATVSSDQDQEEEQEGEEEQVVQETRLPDHLSNTPLLPQKSVSFSNLLDAMDYSILRSVLSDNHFNELPPSSSSYAAIPDQTCFSNCNTSSYISSGNNIIGTPLFQKLPQLSTPMPNVENNKLKRQRLNTDEDMQQQHQSKKFISSCSLISNSTTQNDNMGQYNFLNQTFFNQQLFPNLHLQFQG